MTHEVALSDDELEVLKYIALSHRASYPAMCSYFKGEGKPITAIVRRLVSLGLIADVRGGFVIAHYEVTKAGHFIIAQHAIENEPVNTFTIAELFELATDTKSHALIYKVWQVLNQQRDKIAELEALAPCATENASPQMAVRIEKLELALRETTEMLYDYARNVVVVGAKSPKQQIKENRELLSNE